jgi:hypothetical protein
MSIIPAQAVLLLHEALYMQLGDVAEELATAARPPGREASGEWLKAVARFDRTRILLDAIGWNEDDPERDAEIDLNRHRQVIVAALTDELSVEHDLMDTDDQRQRERAETNAAVAERFLAELEGR